MLLYDMFIAKRIKKTIQKVFLIKGMTVVSDNQIIVVFIVKVYKKTINTTIILLSTVC